MTTRTPFISADEYDAVTCWRRFVKWRAGERSAIKRKIRRRERRERREGRMEVNYE